MEQDQQTSSESASAQPQPQQQRARGASLVAAKKKAHRIRSVLKRFDRFGFTPAPRWEGDSQISLRGFLGSVVLVIVFLAYVALTAVRFFDGDPSVSLTDSEPSEELIDMPPLGLTYRLNVDGRPHTFFYNDSFFRIHYEQVDGFTQDLAPRHTKVLGTKPCNLSSWAGWSGNDARCPVIPAQIGGRYQSPRYTFFAAHITTCDEAAPFLDDQNRTIRCAPQAEIEAKLVNGRFNMLYDFRTPDKENGGIFESVWYLYNPATRQLFEEIYHRLIITTSPNLLWTFLTNKMAVLRLSSTKSLTYPVTLAPGYGGGRVVLSIYARLDSFTVNENRQNQTSLDLIGDWFALYGAIFGFLAIYFLSYNEKKFYQRNPGWDELSSAPFLKATVGTQTTTTTDNDEPAATKGEGFAPSATTTVTGDTLTQELLTIHPPQAAENA